MGSILNIGPVDCWVLDQYIRKYYALTSSHFLGCGATSNEEGVGVAAEDKADDICHLTKQTTKQATELKEDSFKTKQLFLDWSERSRI